MQREKMSIIDGIMGFFSDKRELIEFLDLHSYQLTKIERLGNYPRDVVLKNNPNIKLTLSNANPENESMISKLRDSYPNATIDFTFKLGDKYCENNKLTHEINLLLNKYQIKAINTIINKAEVINYIE